MEHETLLAPRDAGKLLGITSSAVVKLDERGRLHAIRDSAGRRLFRREDVLRLVRERQRAREARVK
jgi:DNA-binding transcriptional MerR regulator